MHRLIVTDYIFFDMEKQRTNLKKKKTSEIIWKSWKSAMDQLKKSNVN